MARRDCRFPSPYANPARVETQVPPSPRATAATGGGKTCGIDPEWMIGKGADGAMVFRMAAGGV